MGPCVGDVTLFQGGFMVFHGFWLVSMVFHDFWLVSMVFLRWFHCPPWFLVHTSIVSKLPT